MSSRRGGEAALAEFSEASLGARLQEAELRFSQHHLTADVGRGLLIDVEADQDFALSFAHGSQDAEGHIVELLADHTVLGVGPSVVNGGSEVELVGVSPLLADYMDVPGDLPAHDRPNIAHETLRFTEFPVSNGLRDYEKQVVHLICYVLRAKLASQVSADAIGEDSI